MANINSTITLQSIVNLASTHSDLLPLSGVGGITNEPALSLCNDVLSDLLTSGNDWKFNSVDMPMLVTTPNKQDYLFAGAVAFTLGSSSSGAAIDLATNNGIVVASGILTVKTLEPHRFKVGDTVYMTGNTLYQFNSIYADDGNSSGWSGGFVVTVVPSASSFQLSHPPLSDMISGAPGITDFAWLASASMVEMNNTSSPQNTILMQAVRDLQPFSRVANPEKVCVYRDNSDGTLTVRFRYVPGSTLWGVKLVYQKKAPIKTSLADTWAPFPDHLSCVIRQALLARMYRYLNSPRADAEYMKLQQEISKAQGFDDNEQSEVHICPEDGSLLDGGTWVGW